MTLSNTEIFIISESILLIGTMIATYINLKVKQNELEVRIGLYEQENQAISKKLDLLLEKVTVLTIELQNKADRKEHS